MTITKTIENALYKTSQAFTSISYPLSWEKLEIDDNVSLWASYTQNYQANAPLKQAITVDLAIIGGGYTGVSTAYNFMRRFPDKKVVILEAKTLGNGASGRNGGMMLNWVYGMGEMSAQQTQQVYAHTNRTIDAIEASIRDHNLAVSYRRDGCLEVFTDEQRANDARAEVAELNALGIPVQFLEKDAAQRYLNLTGIYGALFDANEGQLNGAQYTRAMRPVLEGLGVTVFENTPVTKVEEGATITLSTPNGSVKAGAIVLATNGYTGKLGYFRKSYFPLHSHVFSTAPLTDTEAQAAGWRGSAGFSDDLNRISYATHTNEGHIIFGGGSNKSYDYLFNSRTAYKGNIQPAIQDMRRTMTQYLPGTQPYPISHRWTGTLSISLRRNCSMGVRGAHNNVYYALGYSGHGVTAANMAGEVITDLYADDLDKWRGMNFINAKFGQIPLEPFRWLGYQMVTRVTGKSPREPHR